MAALQTIVFGPEHYLDRTALLLGESGTGKSVIINDILNKLRGLIDEAHVFSPSNKENKSYVGIIPDVFVHKEPTEDILNEIWERQIARVTIYNEKIIVTEIIRSLFMKVSTIDRKYSEVISKILAKKKILISSLKKGDDYETKVKEVNEKIEEFLSRVYIQSIKTHRAWLLTQKLTTDELFSVTNIHFNPKTMLIFDDCTDAIDRIKNTTFMKELFYQGRHKQITAIFAIHTDKCLPPESKKNTFNTLFTDTPAATSYFGRGSTGMDKEAQVRAAAALKEAFANPKSNQKLVWNRPDKMFYKYTAPYPITIKRFGSANYWTYAESVQKPVGELDTNNKFIAQMVGK